MPSSITDWTDWHHTTYIISMDKLIKWSAICMSAQSSPCNEMAIIWLFGLHVYALSFKSCGKSTRILHCPNALL